MTKATGNIFLATALFALTTAGQAANYVIDKHHTQVTFEIVHQNTSTNRVRYNDISGSIEFDAQKQSGRADISINAASPSSGSPPFDQHLVSADIFNAGKFPTIRYQGQKFIFDGAKVKAVEGQLTLLGRTLPVTLTAERFNCYTNPFNNKEVCGGDFETLIDRTLWKVNYGLKDTAKQVRIRVQIEATRQ